VPAYELAATRLAPALRVRPAEMPTLAVDGCEAIVLQPMTLPERCSTAAIEWALM
jgi:hypothetical protein